MEPERVIWCTHPDCAAVAHFEHSGYYGWYYDCPIHARRAAHFGYHVMPLPRPKIQGEIINPHVLPYVAEPRPDFERMRALTVGAPQK